VTVGEVVAERYELEELVGTGGMSSVFKAHDRVLDRDVALKILHEHHLEDDEYVERFRREARAVARLTHPNIVTVMDRGEEDGRQFIVFELVDGENLKELIDRRGPLPVTDALELAAGVARALAFAHAEGIVHRDVKPQNILLNGDNRPKVTDFGIARSLDIDRGVTQTGTVLGTSAYIAPEQARGEPISEATDVYSLGIVLFELLTARLPFEGENFVAIAMRHINEPPPDVRMLRADVPERVAAIVDRALQKDPSHRFPSMDAFAAELEAARSELETGTHVTVAAPRVTAPARTVHRRRRMATVPWFVALLAALALAVILVALFALRGNDGTPLIGGGSSGGGSSGGPVQLSPVASYDPEGDGTEHPESVRDAVDGNPQTYWKTQEYRGQDFGGLKSGVGFVVSAPAGRGLKSLTIATDTPGFTARIQAGNSPTGGFTPVSQPQTVASSTTFSLDGKEHAYYLVWLMMLPPGSSSAHVNEVKATG
jgi:eukaryotic-like serine/threonine-protein kinase